MLDLLGGKSMTKPIQHKTALGGRMLKMLHKRKPLFLCKAGDLFLRAWSKHVRCKAKNFQSHSLHISSFHVILVEHIRAISK